MKNHPSGMSNSIKRQGESMVGYNSSEDQYAKWGSPGLKAGAKMQNVSNTNMIKNAGNLKGNSRQTLLKESSSSLVQSNRKQRPIPPYN